jgi:hypothetical protein
MEKKQLEGINSEIHDDEVEARKKLFHKLHLMALEDQEFQAQATALFRDN